jgi:hypothetical protein
MTVENIMGIGKIIKCTVKESLPGRTDENIQGHIKKT